MASSASFSYTRYSNTAPLVPPLPPAPLMVSFETFLRPHLSHLKPELASQVTARLQPCAKALMSGQLSLSHEISLAIVTLSSPSSPTRALYSSTSDQLSPSSTSSVFQNTMSDARSSASSARSSLSHRLSPNNNGLWERFSLEANVFDAFSQEADGEDTINDDSESSVDEDDVQGTILKALRDRFGSNEASGHQATKKTRTRSASSSSSLDVQEDVPSVIARLLSTHMNSKELLQLAANVTAPFFARPLPTKKDKAVRFGSALSLSDSAPRPSITTLDECMIEALDRVMRENARLKGENRQLQDVIDRLGSWSSDGKKKQGGEKHPSLIQRLLNDEESDPSASFGSRFYTSEDGVDHQETERAEEKEEEKGSGGAAEVKTSAFEEFLHSAINKHVSEALFS
jgi:hypothetical protein